MLCAKSLMPLLLTLELCPAPSACGISPPTQTAWLQQLYQVPISSALQALHHCSVTHAGWYKYYVKQTH